MAKISPLHRVIGAARWEGERLLGCLVILAHTAFLDAGFVPAGNHDDENSIRLPSKVGRTASSLPLRYAVPQLLHRPDAAAVQLRLLVHGRNLVFYVSITRTSMFRDPWLDTYWICLDALAAAALLSGGLDDRLCRRVLVDLCARNGVTLEPTFISLPGDVKAAILARLAGDEDLARVECTCTGLRCLVAERDATLWKPRYEKLLVAGVGWDETTPEMGWKEMHSGRRRKKNKV
ncbi:hypothetical protein E2562_008793 [Oryza meyeriana var. granulata]|uniref:F-box domain-containing protein n=1 Tax=Oryza meyeriana var. granulata TaxID=110450 RepID=A0A6G1CYK2_9ORYZ|nr:hypothetical protein E2562_008793 [Oryza meyeriana var. granulata]